LAIGAGSLVARDSAPATNADGPVAGDSFPPTCDGGLVADDSTPQPMLTIQCSKTPLANRCRWFNGRRRHTDDRCW